jgi:hypothetical protein
MNFNLRLHTATTACSNAGSGVWSEVRTNTKTETVTATVTGTFTPTIRKYEISPSETQVFWNVQQGWVATQVGGRIWAGYSDNGEDIEDVIKRLLNAQKQWCD